MKIKDLKTKIIDYIRDDRDRYRIIDLVIKNQNNMHICDLDLALLLISLDAISYISDEQISLLCDSDFAKLLVPNNFLSNDNEKNKKIKNEIIGNLNDEIRNLIENHELIGEVNIDVLIANQAAFTNLQNNIKIEARTSGVYSFLLSQIGYRMIYEVILTNISENQITDLTLKITSIPSYVFVADIKVPLLLPNQPISISDFVVATQIEELLKLNEKQIGNLVFTLYDKDNEVSKLTSEMVYYSYNTSVEQLIPGSTSLFVMPNEESVKNIVRKTAQTLQKEVGISYLDSYQSDDKECVYSQVKALYDTLREEGIGYITLPPSYEKVGQKIRIPHDVLIGKQGTCLDLTILFVSCLESMGLNAGIIIISYHAYAYVFLDDEHLPSLINYDITKLLDLCDNEKKVLFIECTDFISGNDTPFEHACADARIKTKMHVDDEYFKAIDIYMSRLFGYLPLPISFDDVEKVTIDLKVVEENKCKLKKRELNTSNNKINLTESEINKFDLWEKKLLDLSKRNELIDFKVDRNGQQILTFDNEGNLSVNFLFDAFKDKGKQYAVVDSELLGIAGILDNYDLTDDQYNEYSKLVDEGKLLIVKRRTLLNNALKFFYRERQKAFEESGSNILYMAIGFIEWFETKNSTRPKYAPIILIPIDLKRHSKDSYSVVGREEQPFLNISIFEFFHQEFKMNFDDLLNIDLFSDNSNVTADEILNTVADKIKKLNKTRVIKTAAINIFRFSKAVMWEDIKYHRDELAQNKIIKSILNRSYIVSEKEKLTENFDDNTNPLNLAIPLSADSSQIKAIKDCADGKSFILQGPPGTGKSQTITNIIVNAIYHGKTVLFVAEKMAALEVVQNRLKKLSLDEFVLEAHSVKSDKSSVIEQFKKRIQLNKVISDTYQLKNTAKELKSKRNNLNKIINVLHKKNDYFLSFYDSLVRSLDINDIDEIQIDDEFVRQLDENKFKNDIAIINDFENQIIENGGYYNNPFILYQNRNYSPNLTKNKFKDLTNKYKATLQLYYDSLIKFQEENNIEFDKSRKVIEQIIKLISDNDVKNVIPVLLNYNLINNDEINEILNIGINLEEQIKKLRSNYSDSILELDINQIKFNYKKAKDANFFIRWKLKRACVKQIAKLSNNPKSVKFNNLPILYDKLKEIKEKIKYLKNSMSKFEMIFGPSYSYKVVDYEFNVLYDKYNITKTIYDKYISLGENLLNDIVNKIVSFRIKNNYELLSNYDNLNKIENTLKNELCFNFALCDKYNITYVDILDMIDKCNERIDYLRNWSYLLDCYDRIVNNNLQFIIDYIDRKDFDYSKNQLTLIYQKSIYNHIINKTIQNQDDDSFNSIELKHCIDDYKLLINEFAKETIIETASKITEQTPIMNEKSASSSEIGILRTAINNKCRGKSIRKLFSEIPHILTKYFPVFLMSPISCAQFLDHKMPKFDIVIFDEASQMPTSEAIGAIARGNSLVVVGDSMQLPPTTFFQSKNQNEDYIDIEDQESILDDCEVIGMPSRRLDWHYRSKHESLIRFSNARFYNNSLVTFPSPNDMLTKVIFKNVNGVYDGRGKNNNIIEANAIIKEIERRLKSPELIKRSIGVVTFSSSQQELIEDKLDEFWSNNKVLESKYLEMVNDSLHPLEPIIVKNLENIQGDERDVILFSVCYGPDKNGNMYYRFGPINNVGGEKRLNVAFSRARYEMMIFASFDPSLLSKMNSTSRGAQELYLFLRYAKNGTNSLPIDNNYVSSITVGIEKQIAKCLNDLGYKTVIDVGKSSFRVDIGIIDPKNENEYLLGVICDSYSYEKASTSRDRNIIQPTTLRVLGWNLIRIWSFDYLDDPKFVINSIVNEIKKLEINRNNHIEEVSQNVKIEYETTEIEPLSFSSQYYEYVKRQIVSNNHKSNDFYNSILNIVKGVLKIESPISYSTLCNKVANLCMSSRAGTDFQNAIDHALNKLKVKVTMNGNKKFIWNYDDNEQLNNYRVYISNPRDISDIAKEEIIVAIKEVLLNHGPMNVMELKSLVANCFKVKYVKSKVSETLDLVIDYYCNNKDKKNNILTITDDNNRIALKCQIK